MKYGISLFSSGGIGDLAMRANNVHMLVANELLPDRASVFKYNFPDTKMIIGDITKNIDLIISQTRKLLLDNELNILFATPPCQGMSKNGRGKLLSQVRAGERPSLDPRNRLIIPTIAIIKALNPETVIFENVPEMADTLIEINGELVYILDYIKKELPCYDGKWEIVEFANFGVPQKRQRLITVFSRNIMLANHINLTNSFLPPTTHSQHKTVRTKRWRTVRDVISDLPSLDAQNKLSAQCLSIPFHRIPILDENKYFWVMHTPEGRSAFDNQCPLCGCQTNPTHGTTKNNGINQSNKTTPIYCMSCANLLPRPWVKNHDKYRLMRGFTSAYKRMTWDAPAPTITRNMSYACSDNKLHPQENRVLSLHEAFILHTISEYNYEWVRQDKKKLVDKTVREIIGESIPPKGLEYIVTHLFKLMCSNTIKEVSSRPWENLPLFS